MGIDHDHLRKHVIRPTIKYLGLHSYAAEELLVGTAAQESRGGHYLKQLGGGPAIGVFQMEPDTHDDIWGNYLEYRQSLADSIRMLCRKCEAEEMAGNLYYAAAMARVHYLRVPHTLPDARELCEMGKYWKQHYNTPLGAGTVREFVESYKRYTA